MKQLEYAAGVVSVYRHYLDRYLYKGAKNYAVKDEDITRLLNFGNRSGFTSLYLTKHNGPEMITFEAPGHTKNQEKIDIDEEKIKVNCRVIARLGKEFEITFEDEVGHIGKSTSAIIEKAKSKATSKEDIIKAVTGLGNTSFAINKINIDYDDDIFLPVSVIKNARRQALQILSDSFYSNPKTIKPFKKLEEAVNSSNMPECFVTVTDEAQLNVLREFPFVKAIGVPQKLFEKAVSVFNGDIYIYLPTVLRDEYINKITIDERASGVIATSFDCLGYLSDSGYPKDKIILDHRLYTFNNRSIKGFFKADYKRNCIPYELSVKELKHRNNNASQMIVYSRIPMMVTANCTMKNNACCNKSNSTITLVDRKNENLIVKCNCDYCYNTIYNSKKYIGFDAKQDILDLGVRELRLDFTVESADETKEILELYEKVFLKDEIVKIPFDFTRGHLKRGVE